MTTTSYITITRGTGDEFTQSYDIWANAQRIPQCDGDGIYVGNAPIGGGQTSVLFPWVQPASAGNWRFLIIPMRHDVRGIGFGTG